MTITREQIADLQPGDVVEVTDKYGCTARGPLRESDLGSLMLGVFVLIRHPKGDPSVHNLDLSVISRAPRPLYVNHPRTEPCAGDIVRDGDGGAWEFWGRRWHLAGVREDVVDISDSGSLTLLWDGQTGQVVQ